MDINTSFSIWSQFDHGPAPEEKPRLISGRGMRVSELSDEDGHALLAQDGTPEEIGERFRALAEGYGVSFPQGHLYLAVRLLEDGATEILKKWLRLFAAIGVKRAVLHLDGATPAPGTPKEEVFRLNAEKLKELVPLASSLGMYICLENLLEPFGSAEDLLSVIRLAGDPNCLAICLDTGHLNLTHPGTHTHFIETAGKRLKALHIADNEGMTDQHMMPFGRGNVDFTAIMPALTRVGYDGLFNYEIPGERDMPPVLLDAKTDYLRRVTEYLFSLA